MPYKGDEDPTYESMPYLKSYWLEVIGNEQVGGESIALEGGTATIAVEIPWYLARQFVRFALGWSYTPYPTGSDSSRRLVRENPVRHPRFPFLTASSVSFQGISPLGVEGVGTKVDGIYSTSVPVAAYDKTIATVTFTDRPWRFQEDGGSYDPAAEASRNTYFDPVPSVEIISAEGLNNIKFANGPGAGGPPIPAPFGTLMSKTTYTLNWMWVPHEYISTTTYPLLTPTAILACVGRVNSDTFLGIFPPGTMLLQAPVFTPFRFPIATAEPAADEGFFGWNVRLPLQYFDPTRGVADANYRGHQCVPYRPNLLWYGAQRELGDKVFPEADFSTIFSNPNV